MKKFALLFSLFTLFIIHVIQAQVIDTIGAGSSLEFNGNWGNWVDLGDAYNTLNFPFTFEAWINPTSEPGANSGYIFSSDNNASAYYGWDVLIYPDGTIAVRFGDGQGFGQQYRQGLETSNSIPINAWTHIAVVFRSVTDVSIYFNGVLQNIAADDGGSDSTTLIYNPGDHSSIGAGLGYQTFIYIGYLDEIRLWNDTLSQTTIRQNMCRKIYPNTPGLIGYWRADEANTNNTVYDYSPNGVNGTITGTVTRSVSDAPLGNASTYLYTSNWNTESVKLGSVTGDTLTASQIAGTPNGVQIYAVNSAPYYTEGLNTINSNYFGVFCANGSSTPTYTVTCHYSLADGIMNSANQDSAILEKRIDATDTPWTTIDGVLNASSQTISKITQPSPQEYILDIHCKLSLSSVPQSPVFCRGQSVTLAINGGNTYTWSPATGLSATTGSSIVANPTTSTTYTLIGTSLRCSDTITIPIQVIQDSLKVATSNTAVCQGNPTILTASGAYSYSWSPSTGLNNITGDTITATPFSTTTYTVIAIGDIGCLDTAKVVVNVNLPPTLTISPSIPQICIGQSVPLHVTGASTYHWSPSIGLSQSTGSSIVANPTTTTTYTAYGTNSSGCNDSSKVVLKVNPPPVITITPSNFAICRGYTTTLIANGASTYQWSPSTSLNSTDSSKVIANPSINTTYSVIGTSSTGCIDSTNIAIRVIQDSLKATTNNTSICQGNSAVLTASGAYSYRWSPSSGLNNTTGDTVTATPFSTINYTVIATGALGCLDTENVSVNVNFPPFLTISPSIPQVCSGQSIALNVNGASTYHWSPSTGLSQSTGSTVTANPTTTTTYTAYGTNSFGCNDSIKLVLKVNPLPIITITPPDSAICHGYSTTLTAGGASIYQWSPAAGLSSTTKPAIIAAPTITTTYKVNGTSSLGCIDSANVTIRVVQDSLKVSTNDTSICQGNSVVLTATGAHSYNWSPSTGLNDSTGDTVTATLFSLTTYTLIATGDIGCLDTQKVMVNINLPPTLTIAPSTPQICIGHPTTLNVSGTSTYHWGPSTGLNQTAGSTVTASPTATTTYTAYGTDSLGCNDSTKVTLKVNPLPIVTLAPLDSIVCNGLSVPLSATGTLSYTWSPSAGLTSTTGSAVVAAPLATTTYTVYGTDSAGCTDTVMATVNIIPNSIVISVVPINSIICLGNSASLSASGGTHYRWSPSTALSSTIDSSVTATPFSTTTYTVIGTGLGDCADTTNAVIAVHLPPIISVTPDTPVICDGQATLITASGASTYEWSPSTGLYQTNGSTVNAHPTITTSYIVYGTDTLNCNDSTKFTLDVKSAPLDSFTSNVPLICYPLQIQFVNTTTGGISYLWNFGDNATNSQQNPLHEFAKPGIYTITLFATAANGCIDTLSVPDTLSDYNANVYVANSFTPSIAGVNQLFKPNIECTAPSDYVFRIYDRWGEIMYETSDPQTQGWDGTYKGKPQPLGVYVYYINMTCGTCNFSKKGDVTLIR